jgi:hypothetical protein
MRFGAVVWRARGAGQSVMPAAGLRALQCKAA